MTTVYLICFIAGLLLGVRVMIAGVEKPREDHPRGERTFTVSPALLAAMLIVFGVVGYILTRRAVGGAATRAGWAVVIAAVAGVAAAYLVRKWWAVTPEFDVDEAFVLQGHLARVTKTIGGGVDGEVSFEVGAESRVLTARAIDDTTLAAG